MKTTYKTTKLACYSAYFTMTSVFSLPPLLFATFREMYGISYTLLGTLVLVNFITQMSVDLIFTFFSKYINSKKAARLMPLITTIGLLIYALSPVLFRSNVYIGLLIGTVIFSVSAGLSEVLLSPIVAAIPSDNPQRDMSLLHSLFAFGVVTVVAISTIFIKLFGETNWMYLTMLLAALPIISSVLFMISPMPDIGATESGASAEDTKRRVFGLVLCTLCIFFGSCAENTMSNWISGFMENALHIDKALGDILGMAMFSVLLGFARIMYAKYGRSIEPVLLFGMTGAAVCYLIAGFCTNTAVIFAACILTGFFTSMLWPGTLIMMEEKIPGAGVAAYALMAASGDLGAAAAPQLMGIVVDKVSAGTLAQNLSTTLQLTTEQIGMKAGMLVTSIFPIIGIVIVIVCMRWFKRKTI